MATTAELKGADEGPLITILVGVYVRRILGPEAIGQVAWAMAAIGYLTVLVTPGIAIAPRSDREHPPCSAGGTLFLTAWNTGWVLQAHERPRCEAACGGSSMATKHQLNFRCRMTNLASLFFTRRSFPDIERASAPSWAGLPGTIRVSGSARRA